LRWALGHGLILLMVGIGALSFGMALPGKMSRLAKSGVGFVLIGIGLWTFWDLSRKNLEDWVEKKYKTLRTVSHQFRLKKI
jgi:hypothetical protein|tara:strand:+ start:274 stop:516 length:243 start_codon:yes stop_codon:yes gene_type:complete